MKSIEQLAIKIRWGIEQARRDDRFSHAHMCWNFPGRCCGISSELLAKFLLDNNIDECLTYVSAVSPEIAAEIPPHAWLKTSDDIIIDITSDQFKYYPEPFKFDKSVYVGPYNNFYNAFEIRTEEICTNSPLSDIHNRNYLGCQQLYNIILEYIK